MPSRKTRAVGELDGLARFAVETPRVIPENDGWAVAGKHDLLARKPPPALARNLNERQRWFLDRVGKEARAKAWDIMAHWQVSPKTARRDIRGLQSAGLLRFEGARRNAAAIALGE